MGIYLPIGRKASWYNHLNMLIKCSFSLSVLRWQLVWPCTGNHIVEIHVLSGLVHSSSLLSLPPPSRALGRGGVLQMSHLTSSSTNSKAPSPGCYVALSRSAVAGLQASLHEGTLPTVL